MIVSNFQRGSPYMGSTWTKFRDKVGGLIRSAPSIGHMVGAVVRSAQDISKSPKAAWIDIREGVKQAAGLSTLQELFPGTAKAPVPEPPIAEQPALGKTLAQYAQNPTGSLDMAMQTGGTEGTSPVYQLPQEALQAGQPGAVEAGINFKDPKTLMIGAAVIAGAFLLLRQKRGR